MIFAIVLEGIMSYIMLRTLQIVTESLQSLQEINITVFTFWGRNWSLKDFKTLTENHTAFKWGNKDLNFSCPCSEALQ